MKYLRFAVIVSFIVAMSFTISGCQVKTYIFDFTTATQDELDEWYVDDFGGDMDYTDDGALLDWMGIASPVCFDGDWTMFVNFKLSVDEVDNVYFEIYPGDTQGWEPDNYIWSYFDYVGEEGFEEWYIDDTGEMDYGVRLDLDGTIPHLNRLDSNEWKITKTGNRYSISLNGWPLHSFTAEYCDSDEEFFLNLYAELYGGTIYFESVKVEYKGNMFEL